MKPIAILTLFLLSSLPAADRPNILFLLADDLGYGDVGCYNPESKVPTPHLDRMAKEGMRFTDAHSPSTVCTPTRYSIMTGRMAFRLNYGGVFTGVGGPGLITEDRLTLPGMLREQGYETAMFGKWHIGMSFLDEEGKAINENGLEPVKRIDYARAIPDAPVHRGFDHFFGTVCLTDIMATCAAVVDVRLPNDAAEDSFNLLPVLLGEAKEPVREFTLHQTISLALAIRHGKWKYLDHQGSGGNRYERGKLKTHALPEAAPDAPGQLYDLETDPGETTNLYFEHPEMVRELKTKLEAFKQSGRSAPER